MKPVAGRRFAIVLFSQLFLAATGVHAAEPSLDTLATCRDSWLDWKDDSARGAKFADDLRTTYTRQRNEGDFFVPKMPRKLLGLPVARVYPESAGMAVGFSVLVNSGFESARKAVEKALGKALKCDENSDEGFGCELALGPKKTAFVMAENKSSKSALIGCYYFYEK